MIAQELDEDALVVVQETEYTGAGKHPTAQLTFASELGVDVRRGLPSENVPGRVIAIPRSPDELSITEWDLGEIRRSYLRRAIAGRAARRARRGGSRVSRGRGRATVGGVCDLLAAHDSVSA